MRTRRPAVRVIVFCGLLAACATSAAVAQGLAPVADVDPPLYPFRLGPVMLAPGVRLDQMGFDSNVFVEADEPRSDFILTLTPEVGFFLRPRLMRVIGHAGAGLNYFQAHPRERYIAPAIRARADVLLARVRPFAGIGRTDTRDRPNKEIDARARHVESELGAGVGVELSPLSTAYISVTRYRTSYEPGERFGGVRLDEVLDKDTTTLDAGVRLSLTPLTTLSLAASLAGDDFASRPVRNSFSRQVSAEFTFSSDAIFTGSARVAFRDFQPDDPAVDPFRGLAAQVRILYPMPGAGSFGIGVLRDLTYSFEQAEGFYVETTGELTYTHPLGRGWDAQVRGAATRMNYGDDLARARVDGLRIVGLGGGYTFADESRLGLTLELARRSSDTRPDRRYARRRLYASWTYAF